MYKQIGFALTDNQIEKLRKGKKNGQSITLELTKGQVGGGHNLYIRRRQINKLEKAMGAVRITFSKTQMKAQKGGFLGALLGLARTLLPKALPVLGMLGLSATSGVISGATHKATGGRLKRSDGPLPLYHNKQDIKKIIKTVKKLEDGGIIQSGSCDKCMQSVGEQKGGFIGTLLATLAGSLLPALLGWGLTPPPP